MATKEIDLFYFHEIAYHLMVCRRNDFHFVKSCMSHNGIDKDRSLTTENRTLIMIKSDWTCNTISPKEVVVTPLHPNSRRFGFSKADGE